MNITYIIGVIGAFLVMVVGMMQGGEDGFLTVSQLKNFGDGASVFIVIGCTVMVLLASFPVSQVTAIPKHIGILMNTKRFDPRAIIDQLVELAQIARKNGLLALEEQGNQQQDPFFKQCIMLIVDNNDADQVNEGHELFPQELGVGAGLDGHDALDDDELAEDLLLVPLAQLLGRRRRRQLDGYLRRHGDAPAVLFRPALLHLHR